jgi:DnaA family protein
MSEQLVLDLTEPVAPSFDNFVTGGNAEPVAALQALAAGRGRDTGLLLWGERGAGKSHLLRAAVASVRSRGQGALMVDAPGVLAAIDPELAGRHALVAVDDVDAAGAGAQARLFTLYNALQSTGGRLVVAGGRPPAQLPLRDDLRTRLGWGGVYEVRALADAEKGAALVAWAGQRGFGLSSEVIAYLLAHGRRDMATLIATLEALDRHSLATRRPITVPLLRDWLQRETGR